MRVIGLVSAAVLCATLALGRANAAGADPAPGVSEFRALVGFYQGHWQCQGHFANGKPISSEEHFESWYEATWLHEVHDDQPPFSYRAHSVWGVDKESGALTLTIYDNVGSARAFASADWKGTSITFEARDPKGTAGRRERFVYLRQPPDAFSFEYQVSTDGGPWQMGDHVDCRRGS